MAHGETRLPTTLEQVRAAVEQTEDGVFYVGIGAFDVRLHLEGTRLGVKVFPLGGIGDPLGECEAVQEEETAHG